MRGDIFVFVLKLVLQIVYSAVFFMCLLHAEALFTRIDIKLDLS